MMNYLRLIILLCPLLIPFTGFAQHSGNDSTIHLKEVAIISNRLENFSAGTKIQQIDSTALTRYKTGNLATLLENESPLFIKSYGQGSLATSTLRGGSATHTAVLWNGFNIGSTMNGLTDLSLIPNQFMNDVLIQYGGTSALWGSGAVGGTVHLNNHAEFNKGLSIMAGAAFGSFSDFRQNARVEISKPRWVTSLNISHTTAENDFEFYNTQEAGHPKQKQSNAELKQHDLLFENYFRINDRQKANLRFWYQFSDRNIPPTMLQTSGQANQADENYRLSAEWQRTGEKVLWMARAAWFDENINYTGQSNEEPAVSRSQTVITEAESRIILHENQVINIGLNNTFAQAVSTSYPDKPRQNKTALFASYRINTGNRKLLATVSGRQEITGNELSPFTFSAGADYVIRKWLTVKGNVARIYRTPTFNDLFWVPGGNPDLLPESGYSEELGLLIKLNSKDKKLDFRFEPTVFNRNMDNWILWLPGPGYWSPRNMMEVWSRGLETQSALGIKINKAMIRIGVITNYVVSTNEKAKSETDASVGKQLVYVPMYSGHGKISAEYKGMNITFNQNYTGYRYTSNDNTEFIIPYWISNIYASYKVSLEKFTGSFFAQVNNLFNEQYQVILNRAMPLRNYLIGITIQFYQPDNKPTK